MSIERDLEPHFCFLCAEHVGERFILWQGSDDRGTRIALHEACADSLAVHLLSDAAKFRLGDGA